MRTLNEKDNHYCKCGHFKRQHYLNDYSGDCIKSIGRQSNGCECEAFTLDTLRYLEKLSNEQPFL